MRPYYKPGSWNVLCDVCGQQYKAEQLQKRWDGLMVCGEDFEVRHPQDFIRIPEERISVPYTRPEPTDQFIFLCTVWSSQGVADMGVADCAKADTVYATTF